ncbi:MAG: sirohydrochlorin cobaltochelatase [Peptostreptococcaceae bacterium]|nr:sirohydrochlorin cobaltochelatase [Peptostreptococcaceae bacterium]
MKKGILVASFGTSYEETRIKCIESIEDLVKQEYGEDVFERAFTSNIIRKKLKTRDNMYVNSPQEGLDSLRKQGFEKIVTLSLHILDGFEYAKLSREYGPVAKPLLYLPEDHTRIAQDTEFNDLRGCDALLFMGHGSEHEVADKAYDRLQEEYRNIGKDNIYIGTVEGKTTLEDIIEELRGKGYKKVLLRPFMIVAGDHAQNDMASDEEDSWKSILREKGYDVEIEMRGMGEYKVIQDMFMEKLKAAMNE